MPAFSNRTLISCEIRSIKSCRLLRATSTSFLTPHNDVDALLEKISLLIHFDMLNT